MHRFSLFYILISDGRSAAALHSMDLLPKLIFKLSDPGITIQKVKVISGVITSLIKSHFSPQDISRYLRIHQKPLYMISAALMSPPYLFRLGLFLVYTLPPCCTKDGNKICESEFLPDTPGIFYSVLYTMWYMSHK